MHFPLLRDIVLLLGAALVVVWASHRVRLPPIVGFLLTGVLIGPHGLGLVSAVEEVELLAEVGVILLLFTIGLEFSLKTLLRIRRTVLLGGTLQVFGVLVVVSVAASAFGVGPRESLFLGLLIPLSSTAIVLRLLQERAEVDSPHGRTSLAVLIYQDLVIVPMMLLIPLLAGGGDESLQAVGGFVLKAAGVLLVIFVGGRLVVPRLLDGVVWTRSRELFMLTVVVLCLAVAWAGAAAGLSLALGAFLAGLIVSESEYSLQALADVLPFRDIFTSFFFISIGMLLDVRLLGQAPVLLGSLVAGVLVLKALVGAGVTVALGLSLRAALLTGLALCQVGEFSFILAGAGLEFGLISDDLYQWFLAVSVITMGLTPLIVAAGPRLAEALDHLPQPHRIREGLLPSAPPADPGEHPAQRDHMIVIGFGVNGRNVARAARVAGIPYVVIEINPQAVRDLRARGEPAIYGDATRPAVLEHADARDARVVIVAISDAAATRRITALARSLNPACHIITRTRYLSEVEPLQEAGADDVIPEELETSVEILHRALMKYLVPQREIEAFVAEIRAGGYEMLRTLPEGGPTLSDLHLHMTDVEVTALRVDFGSALDGATLAESNLRQLHGLSVVAIRRDEELLANPPGDTRVSGDDVLFVLGLAEEITAASPMFRETGVDEPEPS